MSKPFVWLHDSNLPPMWRYQYDSYVCTILEWLCTNKGKVYRCYICHKHNPEYMWTVDESYFDEFDTAEEAKIATEGKVRELCDEGVILIEDGNIEAYLEQMTEIVQNAQF